MAKWTIGTLKEYFERILDEREKAHEARFKSIENRLDGDVTPTSSRSTFAMVGTFIGVFIIIITGISLLIALAGRS